MSDGDSHLVPGVSPVRRVDEHCQDFGSGKQGSSSLRSHLCVKVVGTLFKHEVCADIGREWEEVHVPEENTTNKTSASKLRRSGQFILLFTVLSF